MQCIAYLIVSWENWVGPHTHISWLSLGGGMCFSSTCLPTLPLEPVQPLPACDRMCSTVKLQTWCYSKYWYCVIKATCYWTISYLAIQLASYLFTLDLPHRVTAICPTTKHLSVLGWRKAISPWSFLNHIPDFSYIIFWSL